MQATAHMEFIVAAYGASIVMVATLVAWGNARLPHAAPHPCRIGSTRSVAPVRAVSPIKRFRTSRGGIPMTLIRAR